LNFGLFFNENNIGVLFFENEVLKKIKKSTFDRKHFCALYDFFGPARNPPPQNDALFLFKNIFKFPLV
jgi:hypothetical protein